MPSFSPRSDTILSTCDRRLIQVFNVVIDEIDCTVLSGHRTRGEQQALYYAGKSQLQFPNSKHNIAPSLAVDVAPYPIDWKDRERMTLFAGFVLGIASAQGHPLRWGGDWDCDWQVKDNVFDDLVHFELKE